MKYINYFTTERTKLNRSIIHLDCLIMDILWK